MEIKFHVQQQGGKNFSLEVDPSETIRHVKEKVLNSQRIPIYRQIIIYHGQLLRDEWTVSQCDLHHGARILLQLSAERPPSPLSHSDLPKHPQPTPDLQLPTLPTKEHVPSAIPPWDPSLQLIPPQDFYDPLAMPECPSLSDVIPMPQPPSELKEIQELPASTILSRRLQLFRPTPSQLVPNPLPPPPPTVTLNVKVPRSQDRIPIEMEKVETVLNLKWKISERGEMRGVPVARIVLQSPSMGMELRDDQILQNIIVSGSPEIDVFLKPSLPVPGRRMKVKVIPRNSRHTVKIEVNSTDKVSVLRQELERLQQLGGFSLPANGGYFFIHKRNAMDENNSFLWHRVRESDTIETFDGLISSTAASASSSSRPA